MPCDVKEETGEDEYKYITICRTLKTSYTLASTDSRLAKDIKQWIEEGKLKVIKFETEQENEKDSSDSQLIVEIRRRAD